MVLSCETWYSKSLLEMTNIKNNSRGKESIEYHCFDVATNKKNSKVNHQENKG